MLEIEASPSENPRLPLCEARPRAGRSIGSGLQDVGVNLNAYLRQVVGEAINKHLSQYRIEQGLIQAVNAQMAKIFEMMAEQEGKQDDQANPNRANG